MIHYLKQPAHKRGSEHLFIKADGCGGQLWNYTAVTLLNDMTHPHSTTWATDMGKPWFLRADLFRSRVGHTFMLPDRMQGALSRAGNKEESVADIHAWMALAKKMNVAGGKVEVTEVPAACPFIMKVGEYLGQYYHTLAARPR